MRWGLLTAMLFGLFVLEGTVFQVFSMNARDGSIIIIPRFVLVVLIFISLYLGRRRAFFLGLGFGLVYDVLYCDVIGVYAFTMAFVPYLSALVYRYFQLNAILIILTVFLAVFLHETVIYFLFELFGLTGDMQGLQDQMYIWYDYIPTALLNAVFTIVIFRPLSKLLEKIDDGRAEDANI